jgi:hypothetical protein
MRASKSSLLAAGTPGATRDSRSACSSNSSSSSRGQCINMIRQSQKPMQNIRMNGTTMLLPTVFSHAHSFDPGSETRPQLVPHTMVSYSSLTCRCGHSLYLLLLSLALCTQATSVVTVTEASGRLIEHKIIIINPCKPYLTASLSISEQTKQAKAVQTPHWCHDS